MEIPDVDIPPEAAERHGVQDKASAGYLHTFAQFIIFITRLFYSMLLIKEGRRIQPHCNLTVFPLNGLVFTVPNRILGGRVSNE